LDNYRFKYIFKKRLQILFGLLTFLLFILLSKIFYLQIIQYDRFNALSKSNSIKVIPIPPKRGLILDRNNVILADNKLVHSLEIDRASFSGLAEIKDRLKNKLNIEIDTFDITNKRISYLYENTVPIAFSLTNKQIASFVAHQYLFPELTLKQRFIRDYPNGKSSAHIIGYINRINEKDIDFIKKQNLTRQYLGSSHIGKSGTEKFYENLIQGTPGFKEIEVDARQNVIRTLGERKPVPGKDINLTIDYRLQKIAENAFGEKKGALIAIDPENAEVLAYVSQPTFNPSLFTNGISHEAWADLNEKSSKAMLDRVTAGLYPPGSTLKPFVALAALNNNIRKPPFSIFDSGRFKMPKSSKVFRDWKRGGHGTVDIIKAITVSCDTFFYGLGLELGIPKLNKVLNDFGFGRKTMIDINGEKSGLIASKEWKKKRFNQRWYAGETAITAIGQGFTLVTPLQLANATAKLANPTLSIKPHLILNIDGIKQDQEKDEWGKQSYKDEDLKWVKEGMVNVTKKGGTAAFLGKKSNYQMASKTGTAQLFGLKKDEEYNEDILPDSLKDHALFITYAPAINPKIVIAVIVENGGHGGSVAGPIAKEILDAYLEK
jgi:penicillin-binding protein 2